MTHQTHIRRHDVATDAAASLHSSQAAVHLQDDIVRPELRNTTIPDAQRTSRDRRHAARYHDSLAGRSFS